MGVSVTMEKRNTLGRDSHVILEKLLHKAGGDKARNRAIIRKKTGKYKESVRMVIKLLEQYAQGARCLNNIHSMKRALE
jgi:hypothetical protein